VTGNALDAARFRPCAERKIAIMVSSKDLSDSKPHVDFADFAIATVCALALAFTVMFLCVVPFSGSIAGSRDFVVYWATAQQLIHHANPYDPAAMGQIERAAGLYSGYGILYMRNPPWALPLALPLGLLGLRDSGRSSMVALGIVACLVVSVLMLCARCNGRPPNQMHWLGLSFGPALVCAMMGQTTLFSLLGYVLFLYLHRSRPFLAGASLWLCALKPHLFLPFGVVLLVWIVLSRSYRILAGAVVTMATSCALAWIIDPSAWSEYSRMMNAAGLGKEYIPCLVVVTRLHFSPQSIWLQYLAPILGSVWALDLFLATPPRLGVGTIRQSCSYSFRSSPRPYSWVYDGGLAIPALLQGSLL
jgi:hypothetical protein